MGRINYNLKSGRFMDINISGEYLILYTYTKASGKINYCIARAMDV